MHLPMLENNQLHLMDRGIDFQHKNKLFDELDKRAKV